MSGPRTAWDTLRTAAVAAALGLTAATLLLPPRSAARPLEAGGDAAAQVVPTTSLTLPTFVRFTRGSARLPRHAGTLIEAVRSAVAAIDAQRPGGLDLVLLAHAHTSERRPTQLARARADAVRAALATAGLGARAAQLGTYVCLVDRRPFERDDTRVEFVERPSDPVRGIQHDGGAEPDGSRDRARAWFAERAAGCVPDA